MRVRRQTLATVELSEGENICKIVCSPNQGHKAKWIFVGRKRKGSDWRHRFVPFTFIPSVFNRKCIWKSLNKYDKYFIFICIILSLSFFLFFGFVSVCNKFRIPGLSFHRFYQMRIHVIGYHVLFCITAIVLVYSVDEICTGSFNIFSEMPVESIYLVC